MIIWYRRDGISSKAKRFCAALNYLRIPGRGREISRFTDSWALGRLPLAHESDADVYYSSNDKNPITLGLLGEIDNRQDLSDSLHAPESTPTGKLAALAYHEWGNACFNRFKGVFTIAIRDERRERFLLYRSPLSHFSLYYRTAFGELLAATQASVLVQVFGASKALDKAWIAGFLSHCVLENEQTVFQDITELLPGVLLEYQNDRVKLSQSTIKFADKQIHYRQLQDYSDHFLELLEASVAKNLLANGKTGIMLSAGIDSPCLAAVATGLNRSDVDLRVFSWSLTNYPQADESGFIRECTEFLNLPLTMLDGNNKGPMHAILNSVLDPETPHTNIFWRLTDQIYKAAAATGYTRLLNGGRGDLLYANRSYWLWDAIKRGAGLTALRELSWLFSTGGIKAVITDKGVRQFLAGWRKKNLRSIKYVPAWMTAEGAHLLQPATVYPRSCLAHPRPRQCLLLYGLEMLRGTTVDMRHAKQYGIDRCLPYHDADIYDFMLSIPTFVCRHLGQDKILARGAMAGKLPQSIAMGPRRGILTTFARDGFDAACADMESVLLQKNAIWPEWVKREKIESWLQRPAKNLSGPERVALWNCFTLELWRQRYGY